MVAVLVALQWHFPSIAVCMALSYHGEGREPMGVEGTGEAVKLETVLL